MIRELKEKISRLTKKINKAHLTLDFKALESQNTHLIVKVNALQNLNECFRTENEKVKQHYKELYDSTKLTHAKTIKKTTSLLDEIENLKAQLKNNMKCVIVPAEKSKVLAPEIKSLSKRFKEPCETLTHNTPTHPEQQKMKKTNEPVIPSTGVKGATSTSGLKPRSNTKKDKTLPAKSALKKV
uniref:Pyruvate, phosphate dikinase regulatory protein, chloroplastic n=1 Tax=Tanacetum cinerariifolium TaxID=118510 RepID=A0A699JHR8_TANCI|nr:hypothetical protein [Tanacetum cinerariifolium]